MPWSLSHHLPKHPERLDAFFLVVGKALYLASSFEAKCRRLSLLVKVGNEFESSGSWRSAFNVAEAKSLGGATRHLAGDPQVAVEQGAILDAAREARNSIAHQVAELPPLHAISAEVIDERLKLLRRSIDAVVAGDNLVSRWLFEMDEYPAPRELQDRYAERVSDWLWGASGA